MENKPSLHQQDAALDSRERHKDGRAQTDNTDREDEYRIPPPRVDKQTQTEAEADDMEFDHEQSF